MTAQRTVSNSLSSKMEERQLKTHDGQFRLNTLDLAVLLRIKFRSQLNKISADDKNLVTGHMPQQQKWSLAQFI